MKKILFTIIMAAALVACTKESPVNAYIDASGDCIFENNVVRYRINGASNPIVTSGMEAIFKAVIDKKEVVKDRKAAVAASLNDGGSAIVDGDSFIFPAANFEAFEIVEQTPTAVTFTLTYPEWPVGEDNVSLVRTVTIRQGSYYCEVSDVYKSSNPGTAVTVAAGFAKGAVERNESGVDYMISWENMPSGEGSFGVGIVMPMSNELVFEGPENSAVAFYPTKYGRKVDYAIGSCWSAGSLSTFDMWAEKVRL